MAYAAAVNAEIKDLFAAGADIVQIDEPYLQARPDAGPRLRAGRARPPRSTASPAPPPCTSASATPRSSTSGRRATRSCPSWPAARSTRSRSRPRSPVSTSACWPTWPTRRSSSACIDLSDAGGRDGARSVAARVRRAFAVPAARAAGDRPGLRDEVPAARRPRRARCAPWPTQRRCCALRSVGGGADAARHRGQRHRPRRGSAGRTAHDPRLAEIMTALVRHLHEFAREVRLTEAEWMAAIQWLNAHRADQRREARRSSSSPPTCWACPCWSCR